MIERLTANRGAAGAVYAQDNGLDLI